MERTIDIDDDLTALNPWVRHSIALFHRKHYLDNINKVYPLQIAAPERIDGVLRRRIIMAHQARRTGELITILKGLEKFPYDEPLWFLIKGIRGCEKNNPGQIRRISKSLYAMTADETIIRLESAPKLNTQMGPMFNSWLKRTFDGLKIQRFRTSRKGIFVLDAGEEEGKRFLNRELRQNLKKRPDLVAKVNDVYVIGEAKWIGSPGGNQDKQVEEVLDFCRSQRGDIIRVGIIDGFPWAIRNSEGAIINFKAAVQVQESEYDILSTLLLKKYLHDMR